MLRNGGVLAVPTDTVYGLAASIFRPEAIDRIFAIKGRPADAAVPVLLPSGADMGLVAGEIPRSSWRLIDAFWPGALTIVLPARNSVPGSVTAGGGTVAVRVPSGRSILQLLETLGEPIIGTSANRHGRPAARSSREVLAAVGNAIDAVLVDDALPGSGAASTVVEMREGECVVHREGAISRDAIAAVVGVNVVIRR